MMNKAITASILFIFFGPLFAYASETNGTIISGFDTTKICKDATCSVSGSINWRPTLNANTTGALAVAINDTGLTGHLWGDEIGWVNLAPTGSGVTMNANTGELSGYAYANTGGWINFRPTQVAGNPPVGVSINSVGEFTGYAYVSGLNGGWMKFDCSSSATCIKTDWRPIPYRSAVVPPVTPIIAGSGSGVVGVQYLTQPIQQPATSTATTTEDGEGIQIPGKPKSPVVYIPATPDSYPGWVSSSTNPDLTGSGTTTVDIDGRPVTVTITIRPRGSSNVAMTGTSTSTSSIQAGHGKENLLAYKFVPERMRWRVPTSKFLPSVQEKTHVTIPDVDGTSFVLSLAAGALILKLGMLGMFALTKLFH